MITSERIASILFQLPIHQNEKRRSSRRRSVGTTELIGCIGICAMRNVIRSASLRTFSLRNVPPTPRAIAQEDRWDRNVFKTELIQRCLQPENIHVATTINPSTGQPKINERTQKVHCLLPARFEGKELGSLLSNIKQARASRAEQSIAAQLDLIDDRGQLSAFGQIAFAHYQDNQPRHTAPGNELSL